MNSTDMKTEREKAWEQAKAAVRAYARDPSNNKAEGVREAWKAIRRLDSLSAWRELNPHVRLGSGFRSG